MDMDEAKVAAHVNQIGDINRTAQSATAAAAPAATERFAGAATALRAALFGLIALSAVAVDSVAVASSGPAASSGGTIYFSGAIVAPQLEVSSATIAPAQGNTAGNTTARIASEMSALSVTFKAPRGFVDGAEIGLQTNDGTALRSDPAALASVAVRFVDSTGRAHAAGADGRYRVGSDGGVMTLSAKGVKVEAPKRAITVVITYD